MPGRHGRTKSRSSEPQYIGGSRDTHYYHETQHRIRQQVYRKWGIRLAILAVLGFAYWMWGAQIISLVKNETKETTSTFKGAGKSLRESRDERSGANFDPNE